MGREGVIESGTIRVLNIVGRRAEVMTHDPARSGVREERW
jgi:hypothetical protein